MCKKLMFLISFVLLISWGAVASAEDLEISCGTTYTVPCGTSDYDEWDICGTVIVPECATLTASEESTIDGENATLLVDGGTASISNRLNMGKGEGAYLIVQNGGSFTQSDNSDGIKMPDDEGGEIRMRVYEGTVTAVAIELIGIGSGEDRNARIEVCWGATIYACDIHNTRDGEEVYNPVEWLADGDLYGICGVTEDDITIEIVGDCATITTPPPCDPLKAAKPSPAHGEKGVASVVSDVILSWEAACGVGELGRHYVFFSTDQDCVDNAPPFTPGWEEPDC
ncbi:MAG: hypothetical protein ACYTEQ_27820, partial [Planctomycetota bacterium]